jgi:hypothetical protein
MDDQMQREENQGGIMKACGVAMGFVFLALAAGACSASGDGGKDGGGFDAVCGQGSPEAFMACVDPAGYDADLRFVAQPREPGSTHWQEVQDLCAQRFAEYGYTVELMSYDTGVNVIGVMEGGDLASERVLVSAHYDHIPGCPGADDNASGLAGLLQSARILATGSYRRTLVVACWDEEERGLLGSEAYAQRAAANDEDLVANFVYEMIGVYSDKPNSQTLPPGLDLLYPDQTAVLEANDFRADFVGLIHDQLHSMPHVEAMTRLGRKVGLKTVAIDLSEAMKNSALANDLRRSDHAPFWQVNLPGIMITDTSEFRYPQYHCRNGDDVVANLNQDFAVQITQATIGAAVETLELR